MSKTHYIPKGYNTVTPVPRHQGRGESDRLLQERFRSDRSCAPLDGPDGKVGHADCRSATRASCWRTKNLEMGHRSRSDHRRFSGELYVYFPDVDKVVQKAVAEGCENPETSRDQFYGDRSGFIQDPFGHLWGIATHVEDVSPKR